MNFKKFGLQGVASILQLGKGGAKLKNNSGVIEARNAADSAYAKFKADHPVDDNDVVTKKFLETNANIIINGQIDGGAPPSPADGVIYIVTTAGGGYSLNELYRREGGSWVAITLFDGMKIAIADPLTGGADEYDMGVYMYDLDTTDWLFVGPITSFAKAIKAEVVTVAFGSGATVNIGAVVPNGAIIVKTIVNVTQAFDGTAPTLNLGDSGDPDRLMDEDEIDLKTVGVYVSDVHHLYGSDTQMEAAYVADSSTVGQASVLVEYRVP